MVSFTPDQNAISVAEIAIGMMLSLARFIPAADADTKKGNWNRQRYVGTELYGKTIGIVGAGKIGYLTARRAMAFGMQRACLRSIPEPGQYSAQRSAG